MQDLEDRLVAIGFCRPWRAPDCWRVTRIGLPAAANRARREPAQSRALPRWLDRLTERRRPSPYRVAPIGCRTQG